MSAGDRIWLNFLRTNSEAMSDWLYFIQEQQADALLAMRRAVQEEKITHAHECEGQIKLLDNLRSMSTIHDKEKRDLEEHKALREGRLKMVTGKT